VTGGRVTGRVTGTCASNRVCEVDGKPGGS
jgi:hypothetical protein